MLYITNDIILAVELKKLMGDNYTVKMPGCDWTKLIAIHITEDSDAQSRLWCIDIANPNNSEGQIKVSARYNIQKEQIPEIADKLDVADIITVRYTGVNVYREHTMKIAKFNDFSIAEIESTAKEIVSILKSL